MFHRLFNTQIPLFGFPFLGRSGGSLGEVFYKHFPSRNPFLHGLSERFGEVRRSFSKFHLFKDRFLLSRSGESIAKPHFALQVKELLYLAHRLGASVIHLPSSFLPLTSYLLHLTSYLLHLTSYILLLTSYILLLTSFAILPIAFSFPLLLLQIFVASHERQ